MTKQLNRWWFRYLAHEDEAQMTGVAFTKISDDVIEVQTTFRFPEYETRPVRMSAEEARKIWRRLAADEDYELSGS